MSKASRKDWPTRPSEAGSRSAIPRAARTGVVRCGHPGQLIRVRQGEGRSLDHGHEERTRGRRAGTEPADVRLVGVTKRYGEVIAVDSLDLEVERGEFFTLLGPSGSGKT